MTEQFFERPILNSPYDYPGRHWELVDGQPTNRIIDTRRHSDLITPVPKPRKRRNGRDQAEMVLGAADNLSSAEQEYNPTPIINEIRQHVEAWRALPNPEQWQVTPETARLLRHWRNHPFSSIRPFFCQVEAVETAIWLTEVAPKLGARGAKFLEHLRGANKEANPDLLRLALKLATGAGKTTVMAMLIAWQTVNAARHKNSRMFSRGFLIVCPGITIRDRLRVLNPNDPESYYRHRELVPNDMLGDIERAKIKLTNYHAFKLRERVELAKTSRALLQGHGPALQTLETEGQMLQRVMPELMGLKNIVVLNDEAHHCYREKPKDPDAETLRGEDRKEAEANNEAARLWISGLEAVNRKLGVRAVYDLSATPFFLRGSGYHEGTLFPWTVSDFSLMDAIECGIVKLPRVPVARQHRQRRHAHLPQPVGAHPRRHAEEGPRQVRHAGPAGAAGEALHRAGRALRPLREDVPAVGGRRHQRAAGVHRGVQQHRRLQGGLRLHLRLPPHRRRRPRKLRARPAGAVPQLRPVRQPPAAPQHAADRQRAAGIRRGAGQGLPRSRRPGDRPVPPRDRRTHRATCAPPTTSPTRTCCAR